jgi:hypothetical protein
MDQRNDQTTNRSSGQKYTFHGHLAAIVNQGETQSGRRLQVPTWVMQIT